jgi:RNA polymerase sigma-70 factor (ECF subfamily)
MEIRSDEYYIEQVLQGNQQAYARLVDKHKQLVFTVALRIVRSREDAEEIAQDTFVKAFQSLDTFKQESKFSTWLYRIAYNASISKTRKKKMETAPIETNVVENYTLDEIFDNVDRMEENEQKNIIEKLFETLKPDESTLITLYYYQNVQTEEIAQITGLSQSNVKVKLHRIRQKMHNELQKILSSNMKKQYT